MDREVALVQVALVQLAVQFTNCRLEDKQRKETLLWSISHNQRVKEWF